MNSFNKIKIGKINVLERNNKYNFGDKNSDLRVNVEIFNSNFYYLVGKNGLIGATEAYTLGYWNSDDKVKLIQIIFRNKKLMNSIDTLIALIMKPFDSIIHRFRSNTLIGSKKNILAHYDLSNDFYKLWLDKTMTYSCGFFNNSNVSLEEASLEKIDRICRKLNLSSKDSVLEIGRGW